jgi:septin family protein
LCRFPIVEPDHGHTKLRLAKEGLEAIKRIETPIAAVAVIGPYRSGKSFLLNQLLSLTCNKGFGVGHMRDTKTKGIWVWGTPIELDVNGSKVSVLYLDTEGFESIGKSNVYDDRFVAYR